MTLCPLCRRTEPCNGQYCELRPAEYFISGSHVVAWTCLVAAMLLVIWGFVK